MPCLRCCPGKPSVGPQFVSLSWDSQPRKKGALKAYEAAMFVPEIFSESISREANYTNLLYVSTIGNLNPESKGYIPVINLCQCLPSQPARRLYLISADFQDVTVR